MGLDTLKNYYKDNKSMQDYCDDCYDTFKKIDSVSFEEYGKRVYKEKCQGIVNGLNGIITKEIDKYVNIYGKRNNTTLDTLKTLTIF